MMGALVKQRGIISADSAVIGENGKVVFKASRDALLEAGSRTSARGAGKGGEVIVQGERVGLMGNARIDVSGEQGGGTVLVGGDYQGKNPAIVNARQTLLSGESTVAADALSEGNGGKIIAWGNESMQAYGSVSARGGAISGDGGFVELSGRLLDMHAKVDTLAPSGKTGTLLLDPLNLYIASTQTSASAAGMTGVATANSGGSSFTANTNADSLLTIADLTTALSSASVTVASNEGGIKLVDALSWSSANSLTLLAKSDIAVNAGISATTGGISLQSTSGNISLAASTVTNSSGGIKLLAQGAINLSSSRIVSTASNITSISGWDGNTSTPAVVGSGGITLASSDISTGGTNLLKAGVDGIITSGTGSGSGGVFLRGGPVALQAAGPISVGALDGDVIAETTGDGTGTITLRDVGALIVGANAVSGVAAGINTANSDIKLTAALGQLKNDGAVSAGTGTVTMEALTSSYGIETFSDVRGKDVYLNANGTIVLSSIVNGAANGKVALTGGSIQFGNGASIGGNEISLNTKTGGMISTATGVNVIVGSDTGTTKVDIKADTLDFSAASSSIEFKAADSIQYTKTTDNSDIALTDLNTAIYTAPYLVIGNDVAADTNTSGNITVDTAINRGASGALVLLAGGDIDQTLGSTITADKLATRAGSVSGGMVNLPEANSVAKFASDSKGAVTLSTSGSLDVTTITQGSNFLSGIKTSNANVSITATAGTGGAITVAAPGIDACQGTTSACTSQVLLHANGDLTVPLVKAGEKVTLYASGNIKDGDGSLNNIVGANGSITLFYGATGTVDLDAWGATIHEESHAASANVRLVQPSTPSGGGGGGSPPPSLPTIDQCIANPSLSDCSSVLPDLSQCTASPTMPGCGVVLPSLAQCTTSPTAPGCSVVLPSLDQCTTTPGTAGCTAVLPTLSQCTSNPAALGCSAVLPTVAACVSAPATAGCSVVLPTLSQCASTPSAAGCSVVLPTLAACMTTPTATGCSAVLPTLSLCTSTPGATGCSVVLPTLAACTTTPTATGCSVVLPTLNQCISTPAAAGCSAVLPTLAACTSMPATAGCGVVLPTLGQCTSTPGAAGCNVVLPTLAVCTTAPTTAGCTAVLPTLAQCVATPSLSGCSVVLPIASKCTVDPAAVGCSTVLPSVTPQARPIISETVASTSSTILSLISSAGESSTVTRQAQSEQSSISGTGSGGGNTDEAKSSRKTASGAQDNGVLKNEPAKKLYCN